MRRARFLDGLVAPWRGLAFVVGTPSTWPLALVPVLIFCALFALGAALGVTWVEHWFARAVAGAGGNLFAWVVRLFLWLVSLLVALLLAVALAQPLAGPALEALARRRAKALGAPELPALGGAFFRTLRVNLFGLMLTLPIVLTLTLVGFFAPPLLVITVPLKFLVSALMLAWDLLDYPLSVRGAGVRVRLRWMRENFGAALAFGASVAVVFMIPGAGLLFLPAGVAGATELVVTSEAALPAVPSGS